MYAVVHDNIDQLTKIGEARQRLEEVGRQIPLLMQAESDQRQKIKALEQEERDRLAAIAKRDRDTLRPKIADALEVLLLLCEEDEHLRFVAGGGIPVFQFPCSLKTVRNILSP